MLSYIACVRSNIEHFKIDNAYLYLYLLGGQPKPPRVEAVYVRPNAQPQYD